MTTGWIIGGAACAALVLAAPASAGLPSARPQPIAGAILLAQAAPAPGSSVEELKAAIHEIKRRLAEQRAGRQPAAAPALAEELDASARRIGELTALVEGLRGEREQLRGQLAAVSKQLAALQQEREQAQAAAAAAESDAAARTAELEQALSELEESLAERTAQLASAGEENLSLRRLAEELQAANDRMEASVREARAEAETRARERAEAMSVEIQAAQQRAKRLDGEIAALREIAATSVQEVQSLGEQLLASLAENQELVAAVGQLRATREMLDAELVAVRRETAAALAELELLRGQPVTGEANPVLVRLELSDTAEPEPPVPAFQPLREENGVALADAGDGWMMTIPAGLEFAPGSDRIVGPTESLERVAALIRDYGAPAVRVVGHTDAEGDAALNRRLSQRRAQAVRSFLVDRLDLEPRLITTEGYGEERPIAVNDTIAGRRQNRRVEIYVRP